MWAPSSWCHLPHLGHQDQSDLSHLDSIDEAIDNELLLLSNPQSGEGEGNWGDGGLWSLWCLLHSWPLRGWCGDGWQLEPPSLEASFIGRPLRGSNLKVVGLVGLHVDVLTPLPLLSDPLWFEQWLIYLLGLSLGRQWGSLIFQPTYLLLWVGMWHL